MKGFISKSEIVSISFEGKALSDLLLSKRNNYKGPVIFFISIKHSLSAKVIDKRYYSLRLILVSPYSTAKLMMD